MARSDEDTSSPEAPLLEQSREDSNADFQAEPCSENVSYSYADGVETRNLTGSGTQFIWALTFSAGISGLLFGYE